MRYEIYMYVLSIVKLSLEQSQNQNICLSRFLLYVNNMFTISIIIITIIDFAISNAILLFNVIIIK